MHARWLVDVAALLAFHSQTMIQQSKPLSRDSINRYWASSRQRIDLWNKTLREYSDCLEETGPTYRSLVWKQLQSTIEEVLLSDILVRTMCAVTKHMEIHRIDQDSSAIAASILAGQQDSRNRCLQLLTTGLGLPIELSVKLNRIRQSMETWSDTLIALIDDPSKFSGLTFSVSPSVELVALDRVEQNSHQRKLRWQFMMAGCQQWIGQNCTSISANPVENEAIHRAAFNLMHPTWMEMLNYDDSEILHSERLVVRLQRVLENAWNDELDASLIHL